MNGIDQGALFQFVFLQPDFKAWLKTTITYFDGCCVYNVFATRTNRDLIGQDSKLKRHFEASACKESMQLPCANVHFGA